MNVGELLDFLSTLPRDIPVRIECGDDFYDGEVGSARLAGEGLEQALTYRGGAVVILMT